MDDLYYPTKKIISANYVCEYNIYGEIQTFDQYEELIKDLAEFGDGDAVILRINSPGGCVDTGVTIINAIRETKATVVARVEFPSASMAALISLSGRAMMFDKHSELMFHSFSGGSFGKSHELMGSTISMDKHLKGYFKDIIGKFLTKKEIGQMWQGAEIRVSWDDVDLSTRCKRHFGE